MTDPETRIFPVSSAGFLLDEDSHLFVLRDALDQGNGPAICRAFAEVAHSRGMAQIASLASVSPASLHAALADPAQLDLIFLRLVVEGFGRAGERRPQRE
ncbi:hypothetical protein L6Q21_04190 [Sandaracinobacter sp. RS1-74]|uniref:hypothetical protein n=1 Tax=Sandaracinobacteroides sayramensis TaxID=2913411 RepID=UPI001ED9FEC8|nr:hypothetical protein [Sandaracinobacteroides sayramensis]MCG2840181.1 hypothetical protein [Sandaracinobacteroides sayramensis]